ncbi:MAG: hypothetical protein EOP51_15720 [Sphingobacteriales bacterium]|nr:MAG: hypothetical protein EOP51_15720 [Sphingobacteriales bacterium]
MTLDLEKLSTAPFAIVAVSSNENGEDDVYSAEGKAIYDAEKNTISIYRIDDEEDELLFVLTEEEFDEIQIADDEQKKELEADYFIVVDMED